MGYRRLSVPNLYRDERTGIYYVRTKVHGRTLWKTLQGGITGWLRAVSQAEAAGLPVSSHLFPELSAIAQ